MTNRFVIINIPNAGSIHPILFSDKGIYSLIRVSFSSAIKKIQEIWNAKNITITAEIVKPKVTHIQLVPALYPRKGGRMRFPAPKKSEKRAKAVIKVCLMCFIPGYL